VIDLCRWRLIYSEFEYLFHRNFQIAKIDLASLYIAIIADLDIGHVSDSVSKALEAQCIYWRITTFVSSLSDCRSFKTSVYVIYGLLWLKWIQKQQM